MSEQPNPIEALRMARQRMWMAIRMLRSFRIAQLIELCGVPRRQCDQYLATLLKHGYLRIAEPGAGRRAHTYLLARDCPFIPHATRAEADPAIIVARARRRRSALLLRVRECEAIIAKHGGFVEQAYRKAIENEATDA